MEYSVPAFAKPVATMDARTIPRAVAQNDYICTVGRSRNGFALLNCQADSKVPHRAGQGRLLLMTSLSSIGRSLRHAAQSYMFLQAN
jgi:hypothetical protein